MLRVLVLIGILLLAYDELTLDGKYLGAFGNMMRSMRVYFGI
jgi:hypothetical protein